MTRIPNFRLWQLYIRKACVCAEMPKVSDIKSPMRINWVHLGNVIEAKKQLS